MMNNHKPKFIAFYLPQYHVIPENNRWWGENFTEWVRVKNSKPLFPGHYQPRVPYEYYDLADPDVMKAQADLAKRYGIYGFCFYHYWFNGKKLLEKPLEQMLSNEEVSIPFCLSWANENWTRAWEGKSNVVLIEQNYGGEQEWMNHIEYLIPFFTDKRYIKIEGKPVFLIYRTESFNRFDEMLSYWNETLERRGLETLFVVEMLTSFQKDAKCRNSQAVLEFEPMFTIGEPNSFLYKLKSIVQKRISILTGRYYKTFDYESVWEKIIKRRSDHKDKEIFKGAFTDWDNSPRFGNKATIFVNVSPQKFHNNLVRLIKKAQTRYIFINAWNEWSEGAYLEPDKKNRFAFLEAVHRSMN